MTRSFDISATQRPRIFAAIVGFAGLLSMHPAHAVIFEPVSQSRSVHISAQLNAFNFATQETSSAVFNDSDHSLPDGWDPLRLGMNIELPESNCFGQGVASQSLIAGSSSIQFSGLADVNISGSPSFPYMLEGMGEVVVASEYKFKLSVTQDIELQMDSTIGDFRDDDYKFAFTSSDGAIWASTGVIDEQGEQVRSFKRRFTLPPGEYTISTQLTALSALSGDSGFAGRTWAEFSVTVVPEPSALWMSSLGGALVLVSRARRR